MGYTHHWTHKRRFTNAEWKEAVADMIVILETADSEGLELGDVGGDAPLANVRDAAFADCFGFNGVGDDAYETFLIYQNRRPLDEWQDKSRRGCDFSKTARKPYDVAVTACLCYLESRFPDKFSADSDGGADDWQDGLALARRALPRLDNVLRIPAVVTFDSTYARVEMRGGKLAVVSKADGSLHLINESALAYIGEFKGMEARKWIEANARSMVEERRRSLPCRSDVLDRWQARKMRTIKEAAETFGYLTTPPVEA